MRELEPVWPDAPRHVPDAPLPAYRFVGGRHPHPRAHPQGSLRGLPPHPPGLPAARWREDRSWLLGVDLYHQGYLWEAHEAWEAVYFASRDAVHRALVQSLIQLAAALLKEQTGNARGTALLVTAARAKLVRVVAAAAPGERLAGLDPRALLASLEEHFAGRAQAPRIELA